jgi:hypothetical protein
MMRRAAVAAVLAHCAFLNSWIGLAGPAHVYHARFNPAWTVIAPVLVWEVLLAAVIFAVTSHWRAPFPLTALAVIPAGIAIPAVLNLAGWNHAWPVALLGGMTLVLVWRWPGLLLWTIPVLGMVTATATWRVATARFDDGPFAARPRTTAARRLVWLVFDEMSESLAFSRRPEGLALPNLDRLRAISLSAPGTAPSDSTLRSIPALLSGQQATGTVFDDAATQGLASAIAGWYHPYGRMLAGSVREAVWVSSCESLGVAERADPPHLATDLVFRLRQQWYQFPIVNRLPGVDTWRDCRDAQRRRLTTVTGAAVRMAADPTLGLVFLHLPVPHPPAPDGPLRGSEYLAGLSAADRALGRILDAVPPGTAIVISSDHAWRPGLWHSQTLWTPADELLAARNTSAVPFLISLPGDTATSEYTKPFATVRTRTLIAGILAGRITTRRQLLADLE